MKFDPNIINIEVLVNILCTFHQVLNCHLLRVCLCEVVRGRASIVDKSSIVGWFLEMFLTRFLYITSSCASAG